MTISSQRTNFLPNTHQIDNPDALVAMFDSRENKQKLEQQIAYAKKLETFVHRTILPEIADVCTKRTLDDISHQDFHGLRERIFTCIARVDHIIERHNKHTDHVDLLLGLITRENQIFTDVLYNGTLRGNYVKTNQSHLNTDDEMTTLVCEDNAVATTCKWARDS